MGVPRLYRCSLRLEPEVQVGASWIHQAFRYETDMHTVSQISPRGLVLRLKNFPITDAYRRAYPLIIVDVTMIRDSESERGDFFSDFQLTAAI